MAKGNGRETADTVIAAYARASDPVRVSKPIDELVGGTQRKLTRKASQGLWTVAGSGFGKGALMAAAVIVGGMSLAMGGLAYADFSQYQQVVGISPQTIAQVANMSFVQGLWEGAKSGLLSLANGFGLTTLFAGGMLGAVAEVREHQSRIETQLAESRSLQRDLLRGVENLQQNGKAPELQPEQEHAPKQAEPQQETEEQTRRFSDRFAPRTLDTMPEVNYSARERDRRSGQGPQERLV